MIINSNKLIPTDHTKPLYTINSTTDKTWQIFGFLKHNIIVILQQQMTDNPQHYSNDFEGKQRQNKVLDITQQFFPIIKLS
jgi:hypothetical protein